LHQCVDFVKITEPCDFFHSLSYLYLWLYPLI
jgi:hypothetical protein